MTDVHGWNHPVDDSDQWDGFNEAGINHFSGNPIRHLAREVNQNSLDSARTGAASVVIKHHLIGTKTIPHVEELRQTILLCQAFAEAEGPKAKQFFDNAVNLLTKAKISVLEISDFNTKGMAGPSKNGTPFFAFTKANGQTKKDSDTATGSFGIGKFAPYASSELRTVFVSTVYRDAEGLLQRLTQGKAILMSHDDGEGRRRQGMGYWGIREKCQPIAGVIDTIPSWLLRGGDELSENDIGTKLTVIGFDNSKGWQEILSSSVAENFFGAISTERLQVAIDEKYELSKSSITEFFKNDTVLAAIQNEKNEPDQFNNSRDYLSCLHGSSNVIIVETQSPSLGLCELRILVGEGLPKKVCFLRNGMLISDSLSLPGLKSFSDFKDFVAVFECKSSKGVELLRAMEPPRHDDFEPERLTGKDEQQKGKKALKDIASWIREMLKRNAKDPVSEITTLDELREYFSDDTGDGDGKPAEESNPMGAIVIRAKPIQPRSIRPIVTDGLGDGLGDSQDGGEGGGGADGAGGGDSESGGKGTAEGGQGQGSNKPGVGLINLRALNTSAKSRRVFFTPTQTGSIAISLFEAGADIDREIPIKESAIGELKNGRLILEVEKGIRVSVEMGLGNKFTGALKVVAHEI